MSEATMTEVPLWPETAEGVELKVKTDTNGWMRHYYGVYRKKNDGGWRYEAGADSEEGLAYVIKRAQREGAEWATDPDYPRGEG
jgi:regulation of enolase protein 1 (concanavalin A-like superfamily)